MNKLRFGDIVVACLFVGAIVFSFFQIQKKQGTKRTLVVTACEDEYVYPLDKDGRYEIQGAIGKSVIIVQDGKACFEDSPCPSKTCVQTGFVSRNGAWAGCLPNDVFIRVESESDEIDAVAY